MTDGNVFGGFNWTAQQLDALTQFVNQLFQREYVTGFVSTQPQLPGQAEMRTAALNEIYNRRQDIQDFYDDAWGEDKRSAISRMENWLGMTQERMDPGGNIVRPGEAGYEQAGTIDPILYASESGWIDLPEGWGEEVEEGEKKPTIEKLTYDLNKQKADWDRDLQQQGLDLEKDRQDFLEELGWAEHDLDEALSWADYHLRSTVYANEDERERAKIELAEKLGIGQLELDKLIAMQENQYRYDQLALQRYMYDSDQELEKKKLELEEKYNEGDLSVRRHLAAIQELQVSNDYDIQNKKIQLDAVLGERSLDLQEKEQIDTYNYNMAQLAQEDEHFASSLGYDYAKLQQQATEFQATHGLAERAQAHGEKMDVAGLDLAWATLASQMTGPRDWQKYSNVLRAMPESSQMAWAQKIMGGEQFAPFQAAMTPEQIQQQQFQAAWQQAMQGGGQQQGLGQPELYGGLGATYMQQLGPALEQAAQQLAAEGGMQLGAMPATQPVEMQGGAVAESPYGAPGMESPYGAWAQDIYQQIAARPQMVSPEQWANMTPAEREMLLGAVEGAGGYSPDWYQMMLKAAPTGGGVQGTSWFGGGW